MNIIIPSHRTMQTFSVECLTRQVCFSVSFMGQKVPAASVAAGWLLLLTLKIPLKKLARFVL